MRKLVLLAAAAVLIGALPPAAGAQLIPLGPRPRPPVSIGDPAATCAPLRTMPNAPMTYESCVQMATAAQSMQNAMNDPAAARPGDAAMSCDQIKAEFAANGGLNIDKQTLANAQAANRTLQPKQMGTADAAVTSNVAAQMQSNPRQARLMALAQQKNCR